MSEEIKEEAVEVISAAEMLNSWDIERKNDYNRALANKNVVIAKLKELCINKVSVKYSGSGDSGDFNRPFVGESDDTTEYMSEAEYEETVLAKAQVTILHRASVFDNEAGSWVHVERPQECSLATAIKDMTYFLLEKEHPGWEINEGSDGTFVIDVDTEKIHLTHTDYFTSSETYEAEI
jgi:hypothetical protein